MISKRFDKLTNEQRDTDINPCFELVFSDVPWLLILGTCLYWLYRVKKSRIRISQVQARKLHGWEGLGGCDLG